MKKLFILFIALFSFIAHLEAREVVSINDNWRFYFSSENSADYARTISLPHTWDYNVSSSAFSMQPAMANYLRDLYLPAEWSKKRIFIKFYGVESVADLMVNGRYVGEHRGGATAFTFEITNSVLFGQSNRLHVIVNNAPQSDMLPISQEENRYGGIYRDVEIIVTEKSAVSPLYYGSDGLFVETNSVSSRAAEGVVKVHLTSSNVATCQLAVSIYDPAGEVVFQKAISKAKIGAEPVEVPFVVSTPQLWSPYHPNLYRVEVAVVDGENSDYLSITTGFRSIEVGDSGLIKINGRPILFNGVSLYHDYPHVGGAASERDIARDFEFIDEMGANGIRSMTHPHHPYLYDLCDRAGKMVWIDLPLVRAPFLGDIAYYPTERLHEHGRETLREIVAQNYNHPSVVMWGVFSLLITRGDNPVPYITELNNLIKEIDTTRPTVAESDQDGEINSITDLIVWRQSLGWNKGLFSDIDVWSNIIHTNWSNMRSAVSYGQQGRIDQQSSPAEYKSTSQYNAATWKPEGRQREFHEEYTQRLLTDSLFWGVCVNSMFDFKSARNSLSENNSGLVTFDRRERKDIFYLYKAHWNKKQPTLHIADARNKVTAEPLHRVSVYASDTIPPTLYTPLDTITMKRIAPWYFVADSVMLKSGPNKFIVNQGEEVDSVEVVLQRSSLIAPISSRSSLSIR